MKIVAYKITPIAFGDPPLRSAFGLHAPYALRTIIEITTDDGITGVSETHGGQAVIADLEAVRELVIGRDPYQLAALEAQIWPGSGVRGQGSGVSSRKAFQDDATPGNQFSHFAHAYSDTAEPPTSTPWTGQLHSPARTFGAIEVACLDVIGKATGRPVCDLLGGRVRDTVDFSAYLFYKHAGAGGKLGFNLDPTARTGWAAARQAAALDPEGLVVQAQTMVAEYGFRSLKLKAGVLPPGEEVRTMLLLREAFGPNTPLRIDPNANWSLETSIQYGKQLAAMLEYYEDPVAGKQQMAALAQQVALPLATNMCCVSFDDLAETIRLGSVQIILGDHHFWGGLRATVELARICRVWNIGMSMHSNSHLGISLMAMTHLAAAVPNLTYACDTHYPWQTEEVIIGGRIAFEDGALAVPNTPGLGVEIDQAALARLHQHYLDCGLTHRDDATEMQKIEPGWQATRPRY